MELVYWLTPMTILVICSAFFSCSEAALFSLRQHDRRFLESGSPAGRLVVTLLTKPDRLLTTVLFGNLLTNISYFSIASIVTIQLKNRGQHTESGMFALLALLIIIFFSEMFPKSLAVLQPRRTAIWVCIPLAAAARCVDPLEPIFRFATLLSRRLLWPKFQSEEYLELADLERAVELSTSDAALLEQEQSVLRNIVSLSDLHADELMRPRTQFLSFRPPVSLGDLGGHMPPSGYLLITEADSDEVAAAISLKHLYHLPEEHLEHHAEQVIYVPWCTTTDVVLETMRRCHREVAAIVNEFGETIGILTFDDILDTIFQRRPSRSIRLLRLSPITQKQPGVWHLTGMTSVRRLEKHFDVQLPPSKGVTVAGIIQEALQRVPVCGDRCVWGPFELEVLDIPDRGHLIAQLTYVSAQKDLS